jgi:rhodanese-related sulfurtransferase
VVRQPIDEEEPFERIDPSKAKALYDSHTATWIDVRTPREVSKEGRIPGTTLVPLDTLLQNPWPYLKTDNVVFVCSEGVRSALACDLAAAAGLTRIYNLEGGIVRWAAEGFPIEKERRDQEGDPVAPSSVVVHAPMGPERIV